jgi:hypothetical protein
VLRETTAACALQSATWLLLRRFESSRNITIFIIIIVTIAATGYWVHTIGVDLPCRLMVDAKIFPTANPKHLSGVWTLNPVPGGNLSKKL